LPSTKGCSGDSKKRGMGKKFEGQKRKPEKKKRRNL